jgi:hypothetical protein
MTQQWEKMGPHRVGGMDLYHSSLGIDSIGCNMSKSSDPCLKPFCKVDVEGKLKVETVQAQPRTPCICHIATVTIYLNIRWTTHNMDIDKLFKVHDF